jgi:oligopeptide transport system substrate-binding protein
MQRNKVLLTLFGILFSGVLVFTSACSKGTSSTTAATTTTTSSIPQVITLNLGGENNSIDPNKASWTTERSIIIQCFDGLLTFNPDLTLAPMVATVIPTPANGGISADGKTYTIKLRTDVTWSDGQKVTAKDFAFSMKRIFDPDLASEYASFYFNIVGGEDYFSATSATAAQKQTLHDAVGVTAIDDYTLQIKLTDALPTFTQLLALWPSYTIREDMVTKYGDKWAQPDANGAMPYYIGNGPFILKEWVQQDHYTLVRNDKYWGKKPQLTQIIFKEITDPNTALAAYKNNELDQTGVPSGTEQATMADPVQAAQLIRVPQLTTFGLQFNVTKAPFDNKVLRQALSCAIDRAAYVDKVRAGVGKVALSWIPPGMPGFDATLGTDWTFNPTKAKQLLTQAGYPDGKGLPEIKFQYASTGTNPTLAAFLQDQIKTNLGVTITLEPMESKAFSALVNAKQFTWGWYGWGADYPDPDDWLPQVFGTGGGNNKTGYSNPAFDALSSQALKELDNTKRLQLWADAQKLMVADAPMVFLWNRETFVLQKSWVKGMVTCGLDGNTVGDTFLRNVSIQK